MLLNYFAVIQFVVLNKKQFTADFINQDNINGFLTLQNMK